MFFAFVFITRRIALVYIAMFLINYSWLQIIIFVNVSCMELFYLSFELPYKSNVKNVIEIINECGILICGYFALCLIGLNADPNGP